MRVSVGVVDTATKEGNSAFGLVSNLSMTHKFGRWDAMGDFNYNQNTQTIFDVVTTSNYSYGGMLRRKINGATNWSASFRESRSGLTAQKGNNNTADSFVTSFS